MEIDNEELEDEYQKIVIKQILASRLVNYSTANISIYACDICYDIIIENSDRKTCQICSNHYCELCSAQIRHDCH
jgi:hypothetical protein